MSQGPLEFKGRPKSENDAIQFIYFDGCGKGGGGPCIHPLGMTGQVIPLRVPKFITYNRKVVLENPETTGIRIYTDGGPAGFCSHSIGTEVDWWLGLSSDANGDTETIAKAGVQLSGALPYEIEFADPNTLPQPTDAAWEAIIYAHVWWGNSSYVSIANGSASDPDVGTLRIVKHDYDIKV